MSGINPNESNPPFLHWKSVSKSVYLLQYNAFSIPKFVQSFVLSFPRVNLLKKKGVRMLHCCMSWSSSRTYKDVSVNNLSRLREARIHICGHERSRRHFCFTALLSYKAVFTKIWRLFFHCWNSIFQRNEGFFIHVLCRECRFLWSRS